MKPCKMCPYAAVCLGQGFNVVTASMIEELPGEGKAVDNNKVEAYLCATMRAVQTRLPIGCCEFRPGREFGVWVAFKRGGSKICKAIVPEPP